MRVKESMLGRIAALAALAVLAGWAGPALAADGVPARMEAARAAYQKGDLTRAAREMDAALGELHERLGRGFGEAMPPAPAGWTADAPEAQGLGQVGGGLSVTRAYLGKDSSLNASLILDSPAVAAAAALFSNPAASAAQPNTRRVKLGSEEALMRWDAATRTGEITLVVGNRVLLEIEGDNLPNGDLLVEVAKGWNLAAIRKLAGIEAAAPAAAR